MVGAAHGGAFSMAGWWTHSLYLAVGYDTYSGGICIPSATGSLPLGRWGFEHSC